MDWSSWIRRSMSRSSSSSSSSKNTQNPDRQKFPNHLTLPTEDDEKLLGLTDQLVDHVKSFSIDTFKKFPLQDEEDEVSRRTAAASAIRSDLSDWQERHATLVLSKVKELAQLRFMLCPRHLKERQFWRIYFLLVKSQVSEYELRAVQVAKLRRMATGSEEPSDNGAFEVEMGETRKGVAVPVASPPP